MTTSYTGPGKVLFGNGSCLQISAICSLVIPTDNKHLMLNIMLYTPCVTNNFLSMSRFSKDNLVYFEFYASYNLVKDFISHHVLLKGFESGGL